MVPMKFSALTKIIILIICSLLSIKGQQLISPCPKLFQYETNSSETDRWYGIITLLSDADLNGVWLRVILDKASLQMGNWFGEVVTSDNVEYLIKNRNMKVAAHVPQTVKFYVKYDPNQSPPRLVSFRLNAKTVCPEGGVTTPAPSNMGALITSNQVVPTAAPASAGQQPQAGGGFTQQGNQGSRPGGTFGINKPSEASEEDDYFQGDFVILNKPTLEIDLDSAACGTVVIPPKPLITHGQATHEGEFPWHAALYHAKGIDLTYICGGSLISRNHVITVAHCVTRRKSQQPLDPESLLVYLGKYYLKRWSNKGIQDRVVQQIVTHPSYDSGSFTNDIAIIKLRTPVTISNYVRPVCLWEGGSNLQGVVNTAGTVVGWGFDETGRVTEELTKAQMPVVSQETCIYSFPEFFSRFTSPSTFCAGFRNGTSVCNGDSGGGMVFPKSGSAEPTVVWQLRGLVSISVALQNQFKCDSSHYVVFTDVAKFTDWIKSSMT